MFLSFGFFATATATEIEKKLKKELEARIISRIAIHQSIFLYNKIGSFRALHDSAQKLQPFEAKEIMELDLKSKSMDMKFPEIQELSDYLYRIGSFDIEFPKHSGETLKINGTKINVQNQTLAQTLKQILALKKKKESDKKVFDFKNLMLISVAHSAEHHPDGVPVSIMAHSFTKFLSLRNIECSQNYDSPTAYFKKISRFIIVDLQVATGDLKKLFPGRNFDKTSSGATFQTMKFTFKQEPKDGKLNLIPAGVLACPSVERYNFLKIDNRHTYGATQESCVSLGDYPHYPLPWGKNFDPKLEPPVGPEVKRRESSILNNIIPQIQGKCNTSGSRTSEPDIDKVFYGDY